VGGGDGGGTRGHWQQPLRVVQLLRVIWLCVCVIIKKETEETPCETVWGMFNTLQLQHRPQRTLQRRLQHVHLDACERALQHIHVRRCVRLFNTSVQLQHRLQHTHLDYRQGATATPCETLCVRVKTLQQVLHRTATHMQHYAKPRETVYRMFKSKQLQHRL